MARNDRRKTSSRIFAFPKRGRKGFRLAASGSLAAALAAAAVLYLTGGQSGQPAAGGNFTICDSPVRVNCVVDGDTFWMDGTKIRLADIDTPEISPSHCAREEELGQAAKHRLLALLNQGPFELETADRAEDRYGRALRIATRNGTSLGDILIGEGLARRWDGRRHPWC